MQGLSTVVWSGIEIAAKGSAVFEFLFEEIILFILHERLEMRDLARAFFQGIKHGLAIELENIAPDFWIALRDSRRVAKTASDQLADELRVFAEIENGSNERDRREMWKVAQHRDELVVAFGAGEDDPAPERAPKRDQATEPGRVGPLCHGDVAGISLEKFCVCELGARFFRARHGMGADELAR